MRWVQPRCSGETCGFMVFGGIIVPFIGIKFIDMLITKVGLA